VSAMLGNVPEKRREDMCVHGKQIIKGKGGPGGIAIVNMSCMTHLNDSWRLKNRSYRLHGVRDKLSKVMCS
jgi:hypothetical protein